LASGTHEKDPEFLIFAVAISVSISSKERATYVHAKVDSGELPLFPMAVRRRDTVPGVACTHPIFVECSARARKVSEESSLGTRNGFVPEGVGLEEEVRHAVVWKMISDFETLETTVGSIVKMSDVLGVKMGPTRILNEYLPAARSRGTFQTIEPEFGMFSVSFR
jgi:hypothetical protein